jgi:hypothetical protein
MQQPPPRLESAIRAVLAPVLRKDGFSGSGHRFHARSGPWLKVLTVQGSRWGKSFAVNLGVHYAEMPDFAGRAVDPKTMTEAHCDFSRRLSASNTDKWWSHEADVPSMRAAIESVAELYGQVGNEYFERAIDALNQVTPEALASGQCDFQGFKNTKVRLGLALARVRKLEGRMEDSRRFAAFGLEHLGAAKMLRGELEALAA